MQKKSILALTFASALLRAETAALAADAHDKEPPSDKKIVQPAENPQIPPELRAYFLLQMAEGLVLSKVNGSPGKPYEHTTQVSTAWWRAQRATAVPEFARTVAETSSQLTHDGKSSSGVSPETKKFTQAMISKALGELSTSTDEFCKLNFYFIASNQYKMLGDTDNYLRCKKYVDETIHSCESDGQKAGRDLCLASASILNTMSDAIMPVPIPVLNPKQYPTKAQKAPEYTEANYVQCKRLKERSLSITDQFSASTQERRKAHRDMVFWYLALDKKENADKEKQKLFDLVGIHDDRILFPQIGGCGHLLWWITENKEPAYACGMG